jgi:hypothetical protein
MMIRKTMMFSLCFAAVAAIGALPAAAAVSSQAQACVAGKVTAASYTWNFKNEANDDFQAIQADLVRAAYDADRFQQVSQNYNMDWLVEGDPLNALRGEVNDIGDKLCRLETIKRVLAPWQKQAVDRIEGTAILLQDTTQSAITFGNAHPLELWVPSYREESYTLLNQIHVLQHTVADAVAYPRVDKEYRGLRKTMGVPTT